MSHPYRHLREGMSPEARQRAEEQARLLSHRLGGWRGLGYSLAGVTLEVCGYALYFCIGLPRLLWLRLRGRLPKC
jgi:hypothetical protein